jgi:hypothetical protein
MSVLAFTTTHNDGQICPFQHLKVKERNRKVWIIKETWEMIQERKEAEEKLNGCQENDRDRLTKEYYEKIHEVMKIT